MTNTTDLTRFCLELRDDHYDLIEGLDVYIADGKASLVYYGVAGCRREYDVDIETAREAYRALRSRGAVEPEEEPDEPYFDEEAAYEAEIDRRMSAIYDAEPAWAV